MLGNTPTTGEVIALENVLWDNGMRACAKKNSTHNIVTSLFVLF